MRIYTKKKNCALIRCPLCGYEKDTSYFYFNKRGHITKSSWCKTCWSMKTMQECGERHEEKIRLFFEKLDHASISWKYIDGLDQRYILTTRGEIYSVRGKKAPHPVLASKRKDGYYYVILTDNKGIRHNFYLHRLVAMIHLPREVGKNCVNHKNGNKGDNSISNLEWCTYSENNQHMYSVLGYKGSLKGVKGDLHPASKARNPRKGKKHG